MKKDIILFTCIFTVLCLIAGGTYAYWTWISDTDKSVVFTTAGIEDYIIYDEGESHFVGNFQKSATYCGGMSNTLSFSLNTEGVSDEELEKLTSGILVATIKMNINSIESNIASSNYVHWALVNGDASSCSGTVLNTGTFNGLENNETITLSPVDGSGNVQTVTVTSSTQTFTVWIWIDGSISDNLLAPLSGETLDVNVWTQIDMLDVSEDAS